MFIKILTLVVGTVLVCIGSATLAARIQKDVSEPQEEKIELKTVLPELQAQNKPLSQEELVSLGLAEPAESDFEEVLDWFSQNADKHTKPSWYQPPVAFEFQSQFNAIPPVLPEIVFMFPEEMSFHNLTPLGMIAVTIYGRALHSTGDGWEAQRQTRRAVTELADRYRIDNVWNKLWTIK